MVRREGQVAITLEQSGVYILTHASMEWKLVSVRCGTLNWWHYLINSIRYLKNKSKRYLVT